ncbi:MAG: MFS transporter [Candidatus Woesearchaeota archaeon]
MQNSQSNKKPKFWKKIKNINKKTISESLEYSIKEGSAYSVMSGFGKDYLSTFAVALGATNMHLAFLNSFPTLVASIFQLVGARIIDYTGQRMRLILKSVFFQALVWLPLFFIPLLFDEFGPIFLIAFVSLNYMLEALSAPAWNSMMGDIVKENERGTYFGRRNKINGMVAFSSVITAGIILSLFEDTNKWIGFGILFSVACIARLVSHYYMKKIYEPKYKIELIKKYTLFEFFKSIKNTNFGSFVTFNTLLKFAVNISAPFFVPFMLIYLGFSYIQLTVVLSASTITSFLVMLYWGKHADLFGNRIVMIICGILVPFIPLLWLVSHNIYYLVAIQCFSGFVWSGYNLASSNFVFDTVLPERRAKGFAFYNLSLGIAVFLGSIVGAFLINMFSKNGLNILSNYEVIFLVSGVLRFIVMAKYMWKFKEVRKVESGKMHVLFFKLVAVRPLSGMIVTAIDSLDLTYKGLDITYKHVNRQVNEVYKGVNKHLTKHIVTPLDKNMAKTYDTTMKQLQKPYEFVRKHINLDEFIVNEKKKKK